MSHFVTHRSLAWTAGVAGVFSLIIGILMTLDFADRGKFELFDSPQYLELRQQLQSQPGNVELQQAIRDLDLQLRESYFRNRQFLAQGMYMLLGGVLVALVAARWAAALREHPPHPRPVDPDYDAEAVQQRYGKWAAAATVACLAIGLGAAALQSDSVLPEEASTTKVAAVTSNEPDGNAAKPPDRSDSQPQPKPKTGAEPKPRPESAPTDGAAKPEPDSNPEANADSPPLADLPSREAYLNQWPSFRGPVGSGVSRYTDIPQQWNVPENTGIAWKTAVPLPGPNSPIVWENRVMVCGATADEQAIFGFDANTGELAWRYDLTPTKPASGELEVMEATTHAAPTMATDGVRAYAIFASGDVAAVTLDGKEVWHKNLGTPKNAYGHASSLATYQDLLIVQMDQGHDKEEISKLLALRGATGEVVWEVPRNFGSSWASPIVVEHAGKSLVITCVTPWLIAYSAGDGAEVWRANVLGGEIGPSPVFVNGFVYAANDACGLSVVRADGTGDVTDTHVVWHTDIDAPDIVSPLVTDKCVLLLTHGLLAGFDVQLPAEGTGGGEVEEREPVWEEELQEEVSASPGLVGNLVYLFSETGKAWIVEPQAAACKRIGEFEMGEPVRSSPAFLPGRIYIRGEEHLICIGTK
jgi:outer membrane protein assembly factor BamB